MSTSKYTIMQTPIGEIIITSSGKHITGLYTPDHPYYLKAKNAEFDIDSFDETILQLEEYFDGKRYEFDLPIKLEGTKFQKATWEILKDIKYGTTKSYKEVATLLGNPKASRAVGAANRENPLCIIIPCHRVISANGTLRGYNGGIDAKKWLLNHEIRISKMLHIN